MTLATLVLLGIFISLGRWQWQRGEDKQAVWAEFERDAPAAPADGGIDDLPRFSRVELRGRFDPAHQFLLDNRSHQGRPGYEVLIPFDTDNAGRLLVNRGWIPFTGYRDRLPDVSAGLPTAGLDSGRAPPAPDANWPKLTSFPTHDELQSMLGENIARRIVLLDPQAPGGYLREWQPPGLDPSRHFSYAIQWWGFAAVLLVLYFGLNFRRVT
jgi:surfeit locus 1 family protein